jgi:SSS family solute:Na+ symporter
MIAGFSLPQVSVVGAKAGLIFGLLFYVVMYFILAVDPHFVHIWGIEFVLNMLIMIGVSKFYPVQSRFTIVDVGAVALVPWKYTKTMSVVLIVITLIIYVLLGSVA